MTQRIAVALGFVVSMWLLPSSESRGQDAAKLEQQFDQAFQQMLLDPSNLDKSFRYAELGIQIGDYEAAISALERMLLYNPDLPRVRLELGVLYFRLGSYDIARTYLTRAVEGENVPDDVRARVAVFLDEIDNRLSKHRFSGSLFGGLRYQSNANAGPERGAIRLLDGEGVLGSEFTRTPDWNAFMSGNLRHTYDPQVHSGEVLETDLLVYASQQSNQHQLDLIFGEVSVGPRGQFLREYVENASWRPHLVGSMVHLDESPYYYSYGAGVDFDKQFSSRTNGALAMSMVEKKYKADAGRATARLQNGLETEAEFSFRHQLSENLMLTSSVGVTNLDTDASLHANTEWSVEVGAIASYGAPFGLTDGPWSSSVSATKLYSRYHAPDPSVDSFKKREDHEIRANILTTIPLTRQVAMTATVGRTVVDSNLLNYAYNNWTASIGASVRF